MPFRPYNLDTGFDTRPVLPPSAETPAGNLLGGLAGGVGYVGRMFMPTLLHKEDADTFESAFRLENDVVNFVELLSRPVYEVDPSFDLESGLKKIDMWDQYRWNFLGVGSEGEMLDKAAHITREENDKLRLAAAGPVGMVAMVAAGLASPTNLIPFVGPGLKGAKSVAFGAAATGGAVAASEIPMQLNQETRTAEESIRAIAFGTVLGGVLGGAVAYLGRPLEEVSEQVARDFGMVDTGTVPAIQPRSAGAAAAPDREFAGPLKSALGQEKEFLGYQSPVTRVLTSASRQGQWIMAQLSDAGLMLKGNAEGIATTVGGTAESRINTRWALAASAVNKIDDTFARYMLGKEGRASVFDVARANFASLNPRRVKLSKQEFKEEISRAMWRNDEHDIPEVAEAAAFIRKEVYDVLEKEAEGLGLLKGLKRNEEGAIEVVGDTSYLNRDYNLRAIEANRQTFQGKLSAHYQAKLQERFNSQLEKALKAREKMETQTADLERPLDEVKKLREQFTKELEQLEASRTPEEVDVDEFLGDARNMARDKALTEQERADARAMAQMIEEQGGERLAARAAKRKELRERLRSLNRSAEGRRVRQLAKLERVQAIEENMLVTLQRLVNRSQKFLKQMDDLSDEALDKELSALRTRFEQLARQYDRGEERISKLLSEPGDEIGALVSADLRQQDKAERLTKLAEAIGQADELDRPLARLAVQEALDEAMTKAARINGKRFSRAERLEKQAEALDPKFAEKEAAALRARQADREAAIFDRFRDLSKQVKIEEGFRPDFSAHGDELARVVTEKILGTNARLAGRDMLLEPKGAELARVLDIPSEEIEEFLEKDIEHLISQYIRTVVPDIEITRKLGEYAPDFGRNLEFTRLNEEANEADKALRAKLTAEGKTKAQIEKAALKLADDYNNIRRDLEVVISRLRHTRGLPSNPTNIGARAGRIALNANVLRYMGMVTVSSIPDIAQPIMRFGLLRTFRAGWVPFVKGLTQLQFVPRELRLLGAATDMTLHSRAYQISDIGDYMVRGSKFEKGLEYATSKIGMIAMFDFWTTAMKQIAGSAANATVIDAIRVLQTGKGSAKEIKKATEYLASLGYDEDLLNATWKELNKPGGSNMVNGVLWPNTESWDNAAGVVEVYRQAVLREVNRTIITPGVERASWVDANLLGKLLGQFKSFAMSSTTKTMLANLQQRDMAVVTGAMVSLALGGLSYYIWANLTGGKALEDMNRAIAKGDFTKFADEAISRSGMLGILETGQSIASTIPAVAPYVTLSNERLTRQADNDFWDAIGGPTYDLISRGYRGVANFNDFSKTDLHQLRLMLPLQNHFLLRRAFDEIEKALPIQERRK